jgi:hypothetical protein
MRCHGTCARIGSYKRVPNLVRDEQAGVNQDAIRWAFSDYYSMGDDKWGLGGI